MFRSYTVLNIRNYFPKKFYLIFIDSLFLSGSAALPESIFQIWRELTGFEIDVYRDNEEGMDIEDVDLVEFADELEESVINALQSIGCDTAKSVLELSNEELVRRTGLTEDVIEDAKQVLRSEFED